LWLKLMSNAELKTAVEREPCRCVRCHACGGTGTIIIFATELDECATCSGTGAEFTCDRCDFLEELSQEEHDADLVRH